MGRKLAIIISFFCITFFQCSDPVSSGPVIDLFPSKPGNKWQYITHEYFFGKDKVLDTLSVEITKEIPFKLNGKTYTTGIHQKRMGVYLEDLEWLYTKGENGLYQCGGISSMDTLFKRDLIYKNPVYKGESWSVPFIVYDYDTQKFLIEATLKYDCYSTNESLVTPAGTFQCTVYHYKRHPEVDVLEYWEYFEYFAPNIGEVGIIIKRADSGEVIYRTLICSYDIK